MDTWKLSAAEREAYLQQASSQAIYQAYEQEFQPTIESLRQQIAAKEILRREYHKKNEIGCNLNIFNWIFSLVILLIIAKTDLIPSQYTIQAVLIYFVYLILALAITFWRSNMEDKLKLTKRQISNLDSKIFFYQQMGKILFLADLPKDEDFTGYMVNGTNQLWFLALENSYPSYFILNKEQNSITPLPFGEIIDISFKNDEQRRVIQEAQPNNALPRAIIGAAIAGKAGAMWGVISSDPAQPEIVDYVPVNFRVEITTTLPEYPLLIISCRDLDHSLELDSKLNAPLFHYRAAQFKK